MRRRMACGFAATAFAKYSIGSASGYLTNRKTVSTEIVGRAMLCSKRIGVARARRLLAGSP